ncbi:MAG: prepilin-type N-terminal cleavage/methylation domain-containing protein [Candidatus Brocadiia bacterium]
MRRAFTLIELLVVIVIIAILAGMLMPALASARARAQSTSCQDRLHNIGAATLMYISDHGGHLPSAGEYRNDIGGGRQFFGFYTGIGEEVDFSRGFLSVYVGDSEEVWQCPALRWGEYVPRAWGPCTGYAYNYHYLTRLEEDGNWWEPDYRSCYVGRHESVVRKSTNTLLFGDSARNWMGPVQENWYWTPPSQAIPWSMGYAHFRHAGRMNGLWADGHVTSLEPDPIMEPDEDYLGVVCDTSDMYFDPAK